MFIRQFKLVLAAPFSTAVAQHAALALLALGSLVTPVQAGELFQGRCHMNQCSWFSIEERDIVGTSIHGVLFRVRSRDWQSAHPNGSYEKRTARQGGEESTNYVFCSKRKPAVMFPSGSDVKSEIIRLAPGNLDAIAGATIYVNNYYFAVCHGVDSSAERDMVRYGKKFGYSISADVVESEESGTPDDLLKP